MNMKLLGTGMVIGGITGLTVLGIIAIKEEINYRRRKKAIKDFIYGLEIINEIYKNAE